MSPTEKSVAMQRAINFLVGGPGLFCMCVVTAPQASFDIPLCHSYWHSLIPSREISAIRIQKPVASARVFDYKPPHLM